MRIFYEKSFNLFLDEIHFGCFKGEATKRQIVLPPVSRGVVHARSPRGDLQMRPGKPDGENRVEGV